VRVTGLATYLTGHRSLTRVTSSAIRLFAVIFGGCAVVGEIKQECYVYCHCIGYAGKCQGNSASCRRKYVRKHVIEVQFTELLGRLKFDDEVLEWVRDALHARHGKSGAPKAPTSIL
jgi:hypothetical protein